MTSKKQKKARSEKTLLKRKLKIALNQKKYKAICAVCSVEFYSHKDGRQYCSNRCVAHRNGTVLYSRKENESDTEYQRNRKRAYYQKSDKYKQLAKDHAQKHNLKYPQKRKARALVNEALKTGKITKPNKCALCNFSTDHKNVARIEAHHEDYSKPLEVIWLCTKCHNKKHRCV